MMVVFLGYVGVGEIYIRYRGEGEFAVGFGCYEGEWGVGVMVIYRSDSYVYVYVYLR